ncbi:MAG: hypothetical protein ACT4OF_01045 [Caulobacteraceae bacterium]
MSWEEAFAEDMDARSAKSRTVTVGWVVRAPHAHVIWGPPKLFDQGLSKPTSAKSVQACPAAIDFDKRHYIIPCPVDLTLKFERKGNGLSLVDADGQESSVRPQGLKELLTVQPQNEWRHPDRPLIQFQAPYVFVSDEPCYVVQTPPYLDYFPRQRPGVQICGRFPIHIWPRPFSWAFEWHEPLQPLALKRGEPWFYVHFETENPSARVRLVETELTPELEEHIKTIADVTNFVNRTFSMFAEAQRMRPETLVKPKKA